MGENLEFAVELKQLINRHSIENGSNTPDYILAEYLMSCLAAFEATTYLRERWYGGQLKPAQTKSPWCVSKEIAT